MKISRILPLCATLLLLLVTTAPPQDKQMSAQHKHVMQMMQDSTTMNMMMEHIAKNDSLRTQMMSRMMATCKDDEGKMKSICKMMMKDKDAHSMMMNMMGEGKMSSEMKQSESGEGGHKAHHAMPDGNGKEVLIKFKPDVEESRVTAMSQEMGMREIKKIDALNIRVFEVTSGKPAQEIIEQCEKKPFVEYAEVNQTYKTQK